MEAAATDSARAFWRGPSGGDGAMIDLVAVPKGQRFAERRSFGVDSIDIVGFG